MNSAGIRGKWGRRPVGLAVAWRHVTGNLVSEIESLACEGRQAEEEAEQEQRWQSIVRKGTSKMAWNLSRLPQVPGQWLIATREPTIKVGISWITGACRQPLALAS